MAVDQFARMMALDAAQQGGGSYTKAETDALLDGKADLVNGVVPMSQIPPAAIEREVPVADDAARFALTTSDVQLGDTVRVVETGLMYLVVNTAHLDSESGYQVYVAGRAAEAVADQYGNTIDTTYATKATTYTKAETDVLLSGKQTALSQAQLTAVNSGIDSTKVAQIETNKNNISNLTMNPNAVRSGNLNDITTNTYAMYSDAVSNRPSTDGTWYFVKTTVFDTNTIYQEATAFNSNESTYTRIKRSNTWQDWRLSNLTNNQYMAVTSGIDSAKVAQIATNASDISDIQTTIGDINTVLEEVL